MDTFVARQPIFDSHKKLFAYELLFRDGLSNFMPVVDGDIATSKLLSSTYYTIGIDRITGGSRAFINFTERLLVDEIPLLFPKETTVIEILENVNPTEKVIAASQKFSTRGYMLALDDFVYHADLKPLMLLADIIKIDFQATPVGKIEQYLQTDQVKQTKLLAEKVETYEEFQLALDMGFDYFQGYFFSKPEIIQGREITPSQYRLIEIVSNINKPEFDFEGVEKLIQTDLSISYKLLQCIHSAFFKTNNAVSSLKEALDYLGQDEIRRFVSLVALSVVAVDKPNELIRSCCIRAKFCESLANISDCAQPADELFTLGLFSGIDALLDQPMLDVMKRLPLSTDIIEALVQETGRLAPYLLLTKQYEKGDWPSVQKLAAQLCISEDSIPPVYVKSCEWTNAMKHNK